MVVEDYEVKDIASVKSKLTKMTVQELYDLRDEIDKQLANAKTATIREAMNEVVTAINKLKEVIKNIEDNNGEDDADFDVYFGGDYPTMSIYDINYIALSEWNGDDIGDHIAIPKF